MTIDPRLITSSEVHLFDFDGTITRSDSMLSFVRYYTGTIKFYLSAPALLIILLLMKIKGASVRDMKERLLLYYMGNAPKDVLTRKAEEHFLKVKDKLLRPSAKRWIEELRQRKIEVCIITASLDVWIQPFAEYLDAQYIATRAEYDEKGKFIGIFGENCNREEKVNRILEYYDWDSFSGKKVAYGNSKGDECLYAFADEHHHCMFID